MASIGVEPSITASKGSSNPNEPPGEGDGAAGTQLLQQALDYLLLAKRNPRFRLYLISHLCQHAGDWYIRIASLLLIERLAPNSASAISLLIIIKMIPQVALSQVGGALADSFDRRHLMIILDLLGALVTLGFLIAIWQSSLTIFYVMAALRASVHSIYEPITRAIVPLICTDKHDLKRANTLSGMAWSSMVIVGGVVAGRTSAYLGVQACYIIDSATYIMSATVLLFLKGRYSVSNEGTKVVPARKPSQEPRNVLPILCIPFVPIAAIFRMLCEVFSYLYRSGFGLCVLMKATGSVIWGSADILNVEFTTVPGDEVATSKRLGLVFSCIGIGCLVGPVCANMVTDSKRPASMQLACVGAIVFMTFGWIGFAQDPSFPLLCALTTVRALGSSTIYVNSSLLLQNLAAPAMLGRVLGLEFAFCMLFEASAATVTGHLVDIGYAKHTISAGVAILAGTLFTFWSIYHVFGNGAARKQFNQKDEKAAPRVAQVVQV